MIHSQRLKCFGGKFDGKIKDIGQADRVGDHVRLAEIPEVTTIEISPFDLDKAQELATIKNHIYIIDCVHFSKDDIFYFLRPEKWTNKQALMHQFRK